MNESYQSVKIVQEKMFEISFFSLRRYYPDQVLRVNGSLAVLSAGFPQLPLYLQPLRERSKNLGLALNYISCGTSVEVLQIMPVLRGCAKGEKPSRETSCDFIKNL